MAPELHSQIVPTGSSSPHKAGNESRRQFIEMGLMDHLTDLRSCIIHCVVSVVITSFIAFYFSDVFFDWLRRPVVATFGEHVLIGTGPAEALTLKMSVAIFAGVIFALPYIFFQLWKFISPGLYDSEKKYVLPFVFITTACFLGGVLFCYYLVVPVSFAFFKEQYNSINLVPQIRLSEHIQLTVKMLVGFGTVFELPVISYILARTGLLTAKKMIAAFRYVIVGIFIAAAILTPPDALSQILMATPMLFLYCISILVVKLGERPKTS